MQPHDIWSLAGMILTLAIVATVLTKSNTASDLQAAGGVFTGSISAAERGTG